MLSFRALRADEVDCRVASCKEGGVSLLLYKDARCDMNILDETVGPERWQRHHSRENANCTVSIYIQEMDQWIEKEDTGTESNTEAEKGLASDSFKRACFNWGIGRELYTAPFIWIPASGCTLKQRGQGNWCCYDRFRVGSMTVEDGRITGLTILNDSRNGEQVFRWSRKAPECAQNTTRAPKTPERAVKQPVAEVPEKPTAKVTIENSQATVLRVALQQTGQTEEKMLAHYGKERIEDLTAEEYIDAMNQIKKWKERKRK